MKKYFLFIMVTVISTMVSAEIMDIPFLPEEFDVDILQYPHMLLIDNPESEQLDSYYTFTDKNNTYQIRYAFFKQQGSESDQQKLKIPYSFLVLPIIWNVAGYEEMGISNFNDSDVKAEFNGDFGSTVFIQNPTSDFGKEYRYIMINFYCKVNQGIVVQSLLFNDINFVTTEQFLEVFHSFKFQE
ncbi:hypothetical protein [Breznakiella homolactica]|uniref:Uncharacterized protein n=1 Tax=Breznakiella homolactica TaxID=2798577 RepID=A0A7T8BBY9_9SPIR|nr:hypothetical protein [Breznakiella homolactica]QQO10866.1 hypothetical protein JFL75_08105 [Breznakiella homolactica]